MFESAMRPGARRSEGLDFNELAFAVAGGRAEALEKVDRMSLEDAFMWLELGRRAREAAEKAAKRRR